MSKFFPFVFLLSLLLLHCECNPNATGGEDQQNGQTNTGGFMAPTPETVVGKNVDIDAIIAGKRRLLGHACGIVSRKKMAELLGIAPQDFTLRNSSPRDANPTHSSCFFKWDAPDLSNAGILLQMMRNPHGEEFPDYVHVFIESYREKGERGIDEAPIMYKKFEGFGDDGSYSTEGGKYFWRLGDKIIFGIAFNTTHTPEQQYSIATILAKEMTENYLKQP